MKIGFFDSWLWGKNVMEEFQRRFPHVPMILEMDRIHCPYGERSREEIREFTRVWVQKLFDRWADVVILACNTASVYALCWLQNEIFPTRHILGVTNPWAERVRELWYRFIWVLATDATVRLRAYRDRVKILDDSIDVEEVGAPWLVPLIEHGITTWDEIERLLEEYLTQFSWNIDALILGCTHYPIIRTLIEKVFYKIHGKLPHIIDPWYESARRFASWCKRHGYVLIE